LRLIKALKNSNIPLVLIGAANDPKYLRVCKREANEQVLFIDHLPQRELASAYKVAKAHVLASWYDTPGLVSLEAGLLGCNLISTNRGSAREYFQDLAWYCDPEDMDSIRSATFQAYNSEYNSKLKERILNNFTWEITAQKTVEAYRYLMNRQGDNYEIN
jgi:glycosyltransferase involved in cell wall biosynthesis